MAHTAGTNSPISPAGGAGGTQAADIMTIPCESGGSTFGPGDIIVVDATDKDAEVNNNPAQGTNYIFGVAALKEAFTANSTIDRDGELGNIAESGGDLIQVFPAWPGRRFQGNIIDGANDQDGVYAEDIRTAYGTLESDQGYACINKADVTNEVVFTLEYVTPQYDSQVNNKWNYGREAGVVIKNPRVTFVFLVNATVFGASS